MQASFMHSSSRTPGQAAAWCSSAQACERMLSRRPSWADGCMLAAWPGLLPSDLPVLAMRAPPLLQGWRTACELQPCTAC